MWRWGLTLMGLLLRRRRAGGGRGGPGRRQSAAQPLRVRHPDRRAVVRLDGSLPGRAVRRLQRHQRVVLRRRRQAPPPQPLLRSQSDLVRRPVSAPPVDRAGLARLRAATGRRRLDPAAGLFAPDSITRRINREAVLLLGGGRALLLQIAHPLVAAGVAAHSRFEQRAAATAGAHAAADPDHRLRQRRRGAGGGARHRARARPRARPAGERLRAVRRRHPVRRQRPGAAAVGARDAGRQRPGHLPALPRPAQRRRAAPRSTTSRASRPACSASPTPTCRRPTTPSRPTCAACCAARQLAVSRDSRAIAAALLSPPLPPGLRQLAATDAPVHHRPAAGGDPPALRLLLGPAARARARRHRHRHPRRRPVAAVAAAPFPPRPPRRLGGDVRGGFSAATASAASRGGGLTAPPLRCTATACGRVVPSCSPT